MIWIWVSSISVVLLLAGLDVALLNRRARTLDPLESIGWALFWFAVAGAASGGVWFMHHSDWQGVRQSTGLSADAASLHFLSGFLTELALDLDSVFVISAIFGHLRTPARYQHLVLFCGLLLACVVRAALILGVGELLASFTWTRFILAALLIFAALRMLLIRQENADPNRNIFVKLVRRVFPMTDRIAGPEFLTREGGKLALTPLLAALLLIETADVFMAADSIPAVYASVQTPYIVFLSSCLSLMCLRALYPALRELVGWIRYVKVALALLLGYFAVLLSLPAEHKPPIQVTIAAIASALAAGTGIAIVRTRLASGPGLPLISPLGEDADRLARLTLKQARKLIVLVIGLTIVGIGILMLIGPGPGLLVIPIGLALLATEFVWAKKLLRTYSEKAQKAGNKFASRTPRWTVPVVIGATIAGLVAAVTLLHVPAKFVVPGSIPLLIGQAAWAVLVFRRAAQYPPNSCPKCGYARGGLEPGAPCPECGKTAE
jgi:tellurite resistance protein TerC